VRKADNLTTTLGHCHVIWQPYGTDLNFLFIHRYICWLQLVWHPVAVVQYTIIRKELNNTINLLTPNDDYSGRTTPLTSKRCIIYIYSTNIGTEYLKHFVDSPFFPLQNAVCFINLTYLVPVLFTFYTQGVLKLKKNNSGVKSLIWEECGSCPVLTGCTLAFVLQLRKNTEESQSG